MDQGTILVSSILFGGAIIMFLFMIATAVFAGPTAGGATVTFDDRLRQAQERERVDVHGHPSPLEYIRIGVILAVVTALEVGLYYLDEWPDGLITAMLLVFSAMKFMLVALWYMHLKFDGRLFSQMFTIGLATAFTVYIIVLLTFGVMH